MVRPMTEAPHLAEAAAVVLMHFSSPAELEKPMRKHDRNVLMFLTALFLLSIAIGASELTTLLGR